MQEKVKNKKKQGILLIVLLLVLTVGVAVGLFLALRNKGGKQVAEEIYDGPGDISWYDEDKDEFVITTKEELYGFAGLSQTVTFDGKTIKLGADIVVNEGNASEWGEDAPKESWTPIKGFAGKFNGQGHTISGLYVNTSDEKIAMFVDAKSKCIIEDFKLVNTYFEMCGDQSLAAICSTGGGTIRKVYTDAILISDGWYCGGIFGAMQHNVTLEECWFDGRIEMTGRFGGGLAGVANGGNSTFNHCLNTGSVTSTYSANGAVTIGGLCGIAVARLVIQDCLNVGEVVSTNKLPEVGSIIGCVNNQVTSGKVWASAESAASAFAAVYPANGGEVTGLARQILTSHLTGFSGYQRTDLDFDKYWAVVEDSTPVLQYFAETVPSVANLERNIVANTTWYNPLQLESVINTPEDLLGFAYLSASGTNFYGKIIKLGNDIIFNEGKAEEFEKEIPLNIWLPLEGFHGNFDGQGHTISGLYSVSSKPVGLFGSAKTKSSIKNVRIENSYFECTETTGNNGAGSLVGIGGGTIENVYSSAIVRARGFYGGGIVGAVNENCTITNCWFDGAVLMEKRFGGGITGCTLNYYKAGISKKTVVNISHCLNTGSLYRDVKAKDSATIGGIVGLVNCETSILDCLNVGKVSSKNYESSGHDELGSVVACIGATGNCTIDDTWASKESFPRTITTIKPESKRAVNICQSVDESYLIGYKSCWSTNLNFKKYWAVDLKSTPVLKVFAKSVPSIKGVVQADTSWYKANASTYLIDTVDKLYGFAILSSKTDFAGKTIKLGANIALNKGNAEDWLAKAPEYYWMPIKNFAGNFDGQGYTISGLYSVTQEPAGFFGRTKATCSIKNVKIINSYFECTETSGNNGAGSIAGIGGGKISNVYSDAIVKAKGFYGGGIIGAMNENGSVTNCWFDGSVIMEKRFGGGIAGCTLNYYHAGTSTKTVANISHCLNTGTVSRSLRAKDSATIGGIVGLVNCETTIEDCLNVGKITSVNYEETGHDEMGSVVACVGVTGDCKINSTWATIESFPRTVTTVKPESSTKFNICQNVEEAYLVGYNSCRSTCLDFKNYWTVDLNGTPILKSFASNVPSLSDVVVADTSWYSEAKDSFTLTTVNELYGFAVLSGHENFKGKTIKLGNDIYVNQGNAKDWADGKSVPENLWLPIKNFAGTFEGKGYIISGLYGKTSTTMGLFETTSTTSTLQNFSLINSYFESTRTTQAVSASGIAVTGGGTFANIYTDAIVKTSGWYGGGILGAATAEGSISGCWFDGSLTIGLRQGGGIVGHLNSDDFVIEHCLNTGVITSTNTGVATIGGIVGVIYSKAMIDDCLNVGGVASIHNTPEVGSLIGCIANNGNAFTTITSTYAKAGSSAKLIGGGDARATDGYKQLSAVYLNGYNGYAYTSLDFEKYWAVVLEGTPILQTFAETIPSIEGAVKIDTSWYTGDKSEYTITTVDELYGLAELSGSNDFAGITIKLGKDIVVNQGDAQEWAQGTNLPKNQWTPIKNFAGTFDGQGYTISGLYGKAATTMGLFETTNTACTIQNFKLTNSYLESTKSGDALTAGAIAVSGGGNFADIYTDAIVKSGGNYTGGIVGAVTSGGSIVNCWFDGSVTSGGRFIGGITGYIAATGFKVEHCLSSGSVTSTSSAVSATVGGMIGVVHSTITVTDCLSVGSLNVAAGKLETGTVIGCVANNANAKVTFVSTYAQEVSGRDMIGGKGANGTVSGTYIALSENKLTGTNGYRYTTLDFEQYWAVATNGTPILKKFATEIPSLDGISRIDTTWYTGNASSYTVTTAEELLGLVELSATNDFANVTILLGNNIVVNEGSAKEWAANKNLPMNQWTPIKNFAGTFDGKGYTISGLYGKSNAQMSLFHTTNAACMIQNFRLVNTYFESTKTGDSPNVGGIAVSGGGTFEGIYTDAILKCGTNYVGGILGAATAAGSITNCWYDGALTSAGRFVGGITGYIAVDNFNLAHCLNSGSVTTTTSAVSATIGGLVGVVHKGISITDCLNVGTVTAGTGKLEVGTLVGCVANNASAKVAFTDTYAKEVSGLNPIGGKGAAGTVSGAYVAIPETKLIGINGYQHTTLDFANYWTVVEGKTPALSIFTESQTSVDGIVRIDTKWFTGTSTEYTISNAGQLYGLAELSKTTDFAGITIKLGKDVVVNDGNEKDWAQGKNLPKNKWTPIKNFAGTFDGNGKIISGLYGVSGTTMGLFETTKETATIQNFMLVKTYFESTKAGDSPSAGGVAVSGGGIFKDIYTDAIVKSGANYVGGIIGAVTTTGKISNCWFAGSVKTAGRFVGGITGYIAANGVVVEHCLNSGSVETTTTAVSATIGGLVGVVHRTITITDCLNVGTVTAASGKLEVGTLVGCVANNTAAKITFTSSYAKVVDGRNPIGGKGAAGTVTGVYQVLTEENLTGYEAYLRTDLDFANYWVVQSNSTPKLKNFATSDINLNSMVADTSWFTGNASEYTLTTAAQLYGLSSLSVNNGQTFSGVTIKLGNDIICNKGNATDWSTSAPAYKWTPIKNFAGKFNGNGYIISGIYGKSNTTMGLFEYVQAGTEIKNFKLKNTYLESTETRDAYTVGSIATRGAGTFEDIYTDAIVVSAGRYSGGIVGALYSTLTLKNCWFDGSLTVGGRFGGGLVGWANSSLNIQHCLNSGSVTSKYSAAGGATTGCLIGLAASSVTISDSLSTADFTYVAGKWEVGTLIGCINSSGSVAFTNTYAKAIDGVSLIGSGANKASGTYATKTKTELTGDAAKTNTALDFTTYWSTQTNSMPVLKKFAQ